MNKLEEYSPSGQPTCPSSGPLNAEIVFIAESPAETEIKHQVPLVGQAGHMLNKCLTPAGIARHRVRIINCVPCKAPANKFSNHTEEDLEWGISRLREEISLLTNCKIFVLLGDNPTRILTRLSPISKWRGSIIPARLESNPEDVYNDYWTRLELRGDVESPVLDRAAIMPTFHPAAVLRRMEWHIWLINDLKRASRYVKGKDFQRIRRRWFFDDSIEFSRFVDEMIATEHLVAVDTEMDPLITAVVSEEEVHVFCWHPKFKRSMTKLMASPHVLKTAHNMGHDWRQCEKIYQVPVSPPWFDTIAGAHILEPGGSDPGDRAKEAGTQQVGKALSPHISSRFTSWPYHKWLVDYDAYAYCGMDTVVCYDAYWAQIKELYKQPQLVAIAEQDHKMFGVLFKASSTGLLIDEDTRQEVLKELEEEQEKAVEELTALARPHILEALEKGRLVKPKLFRVTKKCSCCRGSSKKLLQCWSCAGFEKAPGKKELLALAEERQISLDGTEKKADLEFLILETCSVCGGEGEYSVDLPLNLNSSDQMGDLFYRALRIPVRRFEGKETCRFDALERLLEERGYLGPEQDVGSRAAARRIVSQYVLLAKRRAHTTTVKRLQPADDGRIRTNFDLWYTPTHRVASREGLLDIGSNLQNIPKSARKFVVADPGHFFLYPDYSQIQGRCQAVLSQDANLLRIYKENLDSHLEVVRLIGEIGLTITRDQAKRVSYAAFFDVEPPHLADILGITVSEATSILRAFFQAFPGAARYKREVEENLRRNRSCTSPTGWTRRWLGYILETKGPQKGSIRKKIRKEALASNPQNMESWVIAEGVLAADAVLSSWITLLCHVHDSVLDLVPLDRGPEAIRQVEKLMSVNCFGMDFPVSSVCGPNWYVASIDDKDKIGTEYEGWTRENVLLHGCPR